MLNILRVSTPVIIVLTGKILNLPNEVVLNALVVVIATVLIDNSIGEF